MSYLGPWFTFFYYCIFMISTFQEFKCRSTFFIPRRADTSFKFSSFCSICEHVGFLTISWMNLCLYGGKWIGLFFTLDVGFQTGLGALGGLLLLDSYWYIKKLYDTLEIKDNTKMEVKTNKKFTSYAILFLSWCLSIFGMIVSGRLITSDCDHLSCQW